MNNYEIKLWFSSTSQAITTINANTREEALSIAHRKYSHRNIIKSVFLNKLTKEEISEGSEL